MISHMIFYDYFDIVFCFVTHTEFKKYFIWEHVPYIQLWVEEIILQVPGAFLWHGICSGDREGGE